MMLCIGALMFAAMVVSAEEPGCRCKNGSKLPGGDIASNVCCLKVTGKNSVFSALRGHHCDIPKLAKKDQFLNCCDEKHDSPGACWK
ncbi:hypothetical protein BGZ79_008005 [Entomortierella chlamydospora]|nr:hypothetical protein BGZ79_008005 [Entomortierella chlamydospora]